MLNSKSILRVIVLNLAFSQASQIHCAGIKVTKQDVMTAKEEKSMLAFGAAGITLAAVSVGARMLDESVDYRYKPSLTIAINASDVALVGTLACAAIKDFRNKKGMNNTKAVAAGVLMGAGAVVLPFYASVAGGIVGGLGGGLIGSAADQIGKLVVSRDFQRFTEPFCGYGAVTGGMIAGGVSASISTGVIGGASVGLANYLTKPDEKK